MTKASQLTLAVELDDDARFENFFVSDSNQQSVSNLKSLNVGTEDNFVYLWGAAASGKTHLLQAICHQVSMAHNAALYVSLKDSQDISPEILEGSHLLSAVCLDDVEHVAGNECWEQALFLAFNRLKDSKTPLLISASVSAKDLQFKLPDLQSRLQSMLVFNLTNLNDEEKKRALQHRAVQRGIELNDTVADYILSRAGRSFDELMRLLDILDESSLVEKRKLSVPLVKSTLGW